MNIIRRTTIISVLVVLLGLSVAPLARATVGPWNSVGLEYPYTYRTCKSTAIVDPINVYWFGGEPTPNKVTNVLARIPLWEENDTTNILSAIKIDHQDVWRTDKSCRVDLSQPASGEPVARHRNHMRLFPTYRPNPKGGYFRYVVGDAHEDQGVWCGEPAHSGEKFNNARDLVGLAWYEATNEYNSEAEEDWGNSDHIEQCDKTKQHSNGWVLKIDYGSNAAKIASTAPEAVSLPEITGTPVVGSTLTAHPGEWEPAQGSFIYEWGTGNPETDSWTVLQEGSSPTWTPTASYAGKVIAVRVRPSNRPSSEAISSPPVVIERKSPTTTTGSASGVQAESATVEGALNPNGFDTMYYFEYGPTTSYGSDAPAPPGNDAGQGVSSVPVATELNRLQPETTYHYRLVASSSAGTSYGSDNTFTTTAGNHAIASLRDEKTGRRWVFYRGAEGALWEWSQPSNYPSSWAHIQVKGAGGVAGTSGLSVMHERESIFVTYTSSSGSLEQLISNNNGVSWNLSANFGTGTSPGSAIANVREPSNGGSHSEDMWVYYVSSNVLYQWRWEGGKWINSQVTNGVSSTSGLAVMHERETIFVTYTNVDGSLEQVISNNDGVSWNLSANFGTGALGSTIANVRKPSNGGSHSEDMWVYYVSSNVLYQWRWEGGKWINSQVTNEVAKKSGLSVMHERETIFVTYTNSNGTLEQVISNNDGLSWSLSANFGTGVAWGSAIGNIREPSEAGNPNSEDMWVYYFDSSGVVWQWKWASGSWINSELREPEGAEADIGGITWARDESTGKQWGYYVGANGVLWQWRYTGGDWINSQVTNGVFPSSGLSVMHERESIFVTYTNSNGTLEQVVSNNDGVSWNLSANFGTGVSVASTIANVREPSNGGSHSEDMWVYYVNSSDVLSEFRFEHGEWISSQVTNEVRPTTGLSVMHERETILVTYTNVDGSLEQVVSNNDGVSWSLAANFGTGTGWGSAIANIREPSTQGDSHSEDMWVYYVNSSGALCQWRWEGGKWINSQVTNEVATTSGLSVMHEGETILVTYANSNGTLEQVVSNNDGVSWNLSANFGTGVSSGSAIASVREPSSTGDPNSENMWVYYVGSNGAIDQFRWSGSLWTSNSLNASFEAHEETSTAKTEGTSGVSTTGATLEGALSPGGEVTHYQFEYGTTTSYGNSAPVPAKEVAEGVHTIKVTQAITGLKPSTTYHYRLATTADFKTVYGEDKTFTTKASGNTYTQSIDSGNSLNAVSCVPSTTDCVVSDSKGNAFYATNVSTGSSATWTAWSGPSGQSPSQAVDCPTTTLCLLADGKETAGGALYYATSLGGSWTQAYNPAYGVDAISCASSSFCVDGQDGAGYFRYSTSPASTSWTLEDQGSASMNGVSCISSSFCAIVSSVGNVYVASSTSQIESSSWTVTNVDGTSALHGVACVSTTSCLAVDGAGNVLKLAISEGKATATKQNIDASNNLTAITCSGSSTCVAVDGVGNVFATTNGGTSWSKEYTTSTDLTSVSCASTSLCATVDTTGKVTSFVP